MARDGFVHRIVQHFGNKVVQRAFVGAANIHARSAAHWLKPFEHLDRRAVISLARGAAWGFKQIVRHGRQPRPRRA
jgi:hypothetical protein